MALHPSVLAELPEALKGYKLLERLGRGGFGEVWKVEAPGGFLKAMKFVFGNLEDIDEGGQPAEQELKALHRVKSIRHPYILSLERFDVIEGQLIIVMELAEKTLWDKFRECRLAGQVGIPRDELMSLLTEAAEALDLMNNYYQVQHLDIKPQNLFLVFNHVKVADFGLAKAFEGARATVTGGVTPVYAAPETFEGYVSRYSDQYSLAIVFQELLTGCRPFNGANTKQLLLQHLRELPDLSSLPAADRPIIGRALSKNPNERWPTCAEMLKRLAAGGVAAPSNNPDRGALPLPESVPTPRKAEALAPAGATLAANAFHRAHGSSGFPAPTRFPAAAPRTPMPSLVTPKLVTPKSVGGGLAAPALTQSRREVIETGRMGRMGIAPPEKGGEGVLFPAVVVGVGAVGLSVVRKLRQLILDRFGSADAVPTLRFLFIDTDAETVESAGQGDAAFGPHEVYHAKLNRPAHYLQKEGLPSIDPWMPPGLLYQLPKSPTSAQGVRAFGRLALCDHYRPLAERIRADVEGFVNGDPLAAAAKATGLGVRTNRPRVYVVAGTGGGTGGGMFLDLAYLIKHEFRQVGYAAPEAVALLLTPAADKRTSQGALANTFAALTETYHFASGERFESRYDTAEAPVVEVRNPFNRLAVVDLPKSQKAADQARVVGGAARALYLDLLTPVGRAADYVRSVAPVDRYAGPVAQPFGLYRLSWPRVELLAALTRRFSQQILRRWTDKETTHLREPIQAWLADQWARLELEPARLIGRLTAAVTEQLREKPEAVFEAAVDALRTSTPVAGKLGAHAAAGALDQVIKLVGKPTCESGEPGTLVGVIDAAARLVLATAEGHLATVAVSFIEQPQYRLAGAEESLAQIITRLNDAIERLDADKRLLAREEVESFARMFPLIGGLNAGGFSVLGGRRASLSAELFDLLGTYPKKRYRLLLVSAALTVYRGLLASIPECLREVNHCRRYLDGVATAASAGEPTAGPDAEPGGFILPVGCADLDAAADQFLAALSPEELLQFDQQLQEAVREKFNGVASVCTKPRRGEKFPKLLHTAARDFLEARLERADPVEALVRYRGDGADGQQLLADAFDHAKPSVEVPKNPPPMEATLLAAPAGPTGDLLRRLAAEANPGIEFIPAELTDALVVLREYPRLPLADLPQLGPAAREAYQARLAAGSCPHARADITWVPPVRPGAPA